MGEEHGRKDAANIVARSNEPKVNTVRIMLPPHDRGAAPANQSSLPASPHLVAYGDYQNDEISLVDLWLTVARHKKLVLSIFSIVLLGGVIAALFLPKSYTYSTAIEISKYWGGNGYSQLEPPESVKSKLENVYIPQVTLGENSEKPLEVKVENPKNSPLIVLKSKAPEVDAERVQSVHEGIVQAIAKEHAEQLSRLREIYQSQLQAAQTEVQALESTAAEGSLTLLLDKKRQIDDLTARLEGMMPTHAPQVATRSTQASSPGKVLILALSGFLGLLAGLFATFIAEFRDKVIQRMAEQAEESGGA